MRECEEKIAMALREVMENILEEVREGVREAEPPTNSEFLSFFVLYSRLNSTMFMPLDRLQLKISAFSGKFNVCSKRVLSS